MIKGVGVDTATVARIAKSMQRESFLSRIFSEAEQAEFAQRGMRAESVAAAFAAKEAFSKALGTGLSGFVWTQAQVLHAPSGAPYFAFCGFLAQQLREQGLHAHLSLTHEGGFATAFVILEQKEQEL